MPPCAAAAASSTGTGDLPSATPQREECNPPYYMDDKGYVYAQQYVDERAHCIGHGSSQISRAPFFNCVVRFIVMSHESSVMSQDL